MTPYLIALDLDGTLLTSDKTISERTKSVITDLNRQGHQFVISTGRPYRASQNYYDELGLNTPIINFNGAFIHHPLDTTWGSHHFPMTLETAVSVLKTCEAYRLNNIIAEVRDDVYIQHPDPEVIEAFQSGNPRITTGNVQAMLTDHPTSVLIEVNHQDVDHVIRALDTHHAQAIKQRSWGDPSNIIEVIRSGVSKAEGLKLVAHDLGIPQDKIIAFGDEDNDLEMLSYAQYGIAMGNAADEVKQIAFDTTDTNDQDGIGNYLETFFSS